MAVRIDSSLEGIDWVQAKADLAADDFDNGRSADALRRSFEQSQHVAIARDGDRVVGMARLLSDGVCNAYLVDVWTRVVAPPAGNRVGDGAVARATHVPGQHIGLQTDDAQALLRVARLPAAARVLVARRRQVARQRRQPLGRSDADHSRTTTVSAIGMISVTGRSARSACSRIFSGLEAS